MTVHVYHPRNFNPAGLLQVLGYLHGEGQSSLGQPRQFYKLGQSKLESFTNNDSITPTLLHIRDALQYTSVPAQPDFAVRPLACLFLERLWVLASIMEWNAISKAAGLLCSTWC